MQRPSRKQIAETSRTLVRLPLLVGLLLSLTGCIDPPPQEGKLELVWGERGVTPGRLQKPRAMAIDRDDQLYIVDMTARIQVFDRDGQYLRGWQTPESKNGRPTGLSFDGDGNLLVADTHYYRMLVYTPQGELLTKKTIGGQKGHGPGQFNFVTDAVQDSQGNYYVSEYGEFDRIQKFTRDGKFIMQFGSHGSEPGQFVRPQNLEIDDRDHIWVADACNHRIQVFDATSNRPEDVKLLAVWGEQGDQPGQLHYPFDLALDGAGQLYVVEFGNHRVQRFSLDGKSLGCWGVGGKRDGELHQPWALVRDSRGRIHVLDTMNHRVQRVHF